MNLHFGNLYRVSSFLKNAKMQLTSEPRLQTCMAHVWCVLSFSHFKVYFRQNVAPEAFLFDGVSHLKHFLDELLLRRNGHSTKVFFRRDISRRNCSFCEMVVDKIVLDEMSCSCCA